MTLKIREGRGYLFSEEDLDNPGGQNNLTAFASMFQRSLYREKLYPKTSPLPLDTWYGRGFFGKVDKYQNTVIPDTTNLRQLASAPSPIFVHDFLVNAFEAFVEHMQDAYMVGAVNKTGNPEMLSPVAQIGYLDPTRLYNQVHQTLGEQFILSFNPPREAPIDGFQQFAKYYAQFLRDMATLFPITKTNFILSYRTDSFSTGLSISLSTDDAADDRTKSDKYLRDPNFDFYTHAAKKFGLAVNKNKPWVLTADLFTAALQRYLDGYQNPWTGIPITPANFFSTYYKRTYLTDIQDLQQLFLKIYKFLSLGAPLYQQESICPNGTFKYVNRNRELYNDAMASMLSPQFLIDLYIDLRQVETKNPLKELDLKRLRLSAYRQYQLVLPGGRRHPLTPLQRAAREINRHFRRYIYPSTLPQLTGISPSMIKKHGTPRLGDK